MDDSTIDNGAEHYIPGSHRWDSLPITGLAGNGECTFHHPLMVHGSFEDRTERPRRAAVINAFLDGVRSDSDRRADAGQFLPLLFDPSVLG